MKKIVATVIGCLFLVASFVVDLDFSSSVRTGKGDGENAEVVNISEFSDVLRDVSDILSNVSTSLFFGKSEQSQISEKVNGVKLFFEENTNKSESKRLGSVSVKEISEQSVYVSSDDGLCMEIQIESDGEFFATSTNLYMEYTVKMTMNDMSFDVGAETYVDDSCFLLRFNKLVVKALNEYNDYLVRNSEMKKWTNYQEYTSLSFNFKEIFYDNISQQYETMYKYLKNHNESDFVEEGKKFKISDDNLKAFIFSDAGLSEQEYEDAKVKGEIIIDLSSAQKPKLHADYDCSGYYEYEGGSFKSSVKLEQTYYNLNNTVIYAPEEFKTFNSEDIYE